MGVPDRVRLAMLAFNITLVGELCLVRHGRARHNWPDTATSPGIGSRVAGAATAGLLAMITARVWPHRLATLPVTLFTAQRQTSIRETSAMRRGRAGLPP